MRKSQVEFLEKFQDRGIKIARVNSILITKSVDLQFTLFFLLRGPLSSKAIFRAHSIDSEVYGIIFINKKFMPNIYIYVYIFIIYSKYLPNTYIGMTQTSLSRRLTMYMASGGPKSHLDTAHGTKLKRNPG